MHVFFDVDGVLNKESDWRIPFLLDIGCVSAFAELVRGIRKKAGDVRLILTSTWRAGRGDGKDAPSPQYLSLEKALAAEGLRIYGATPLSQKGRQAEVEHYIRREMVDRYIVIDDDPSLFEDPSRINLYVPDYRYGLTKKDVRAAIRQALSWRG